MVAPVEYGVKSEHIEHWDVELLKIAEINHVLVLSLQGHDSFIVYKTMWFSSWTFWVSGEFDSSAEMKMRQSV